MQDIIVFFNMYERSNVLPRDPGQVVLDRYVLSLNNCSFVCKSLFLCMEYEHLITLLCTYCKKKVCSTSHVNLFYFATDNINIPPHVFAKILNANARALSRDFINTKSPPKLMHNALINLRNCAVIFYFPDPVQTLLS